MLLDSSFVIDLLNEWADQASGPATAWLKRNPRARLWVSAVTVAEVLEGAEDLDALGRLLNRFRWQGLHHSHAMRVALLQQRRNSGWQRMMRQADVVLELRGKIVGHDPKALAGLGAGYLDHRTSPAGIR